MRAHVALVALAVVAAGCPKKGPNTNDRGTVEAPYTYPDLPCEPGTSLAGRAPPEGFKVWCRKLQPNGQWIDHGGMLEFFPNGNRSVLGNWNEGRKDGLWITYYETGEQQSEETFVDNKAEGWSTSWWPNGVVKAEGNKVGGKEDGEWTYLHDNGALFKKGLWVEGEPEGLWIEYDPEGKALRERHYKFGRLLSHKELEP